MKITNNYSQYQYQTNANQNNKKSTTFSQAITQAVRQNTGVPVTSTNMVGQNIRVFMPTKNTLYSGGNGTGLSFILEYAENSTAANPIVFAKGVDENGKAFEKNINVNNINPTNATLVEMRVLEAYLNVPKGNGSSLPSETGPMNLNDRANFFDMFNKEIADSKKLGQHQYAQLLTNSMKYYTDFMSKHKAFFN